MERFKNCHLFGVDEQYFQRYTQDIRNITPAQIQHLAKIWLQEDDLLELVVGKY